MKLPDMYTFTYTDAGICIKLIKLVGKAMEEYNKVRSKIDTKGKKKKLYDKKID